MNPVGLYRSSTSRTQRRRLELGSLLTLLSAFDVAVVGGLAYVADSFFGVRVIDVSNSAAPVELSSTGHCPTSAQSIGDLAVEDGNPYLAYLSSGLRLDRRLEPGCGLWGSDGTLDPTYGARDVAIAGGLAYVVGAYRPGSGRPLEPGVSSRESTRSRSESARNRGARRTGLTQ